MQGYYGIRLGRLMPRPGLRTKIIAITMTIMVLSVGFNTLVTGRLFRDGYYGALSQEAHVVARHLRVQLERILGMGIRLEDVRGFNRQCAEIVRDNPDVSYAMVVSADGRILFHNDPSEAGRPLDVPELIRALDRDDRGVFRTGTGGQTRYNAVAPVGTNASRPQVVVGFPAALIEHKAHTLVAWSIAAGVVSMATGGGILVVGLSLTVRRPLKGLLSTVQEIRQGQDLTKRVAVSSRDELGQFAEAFNRMAERLQQAHDELELRVQQRTAELVAANRDLKASDEALERANATLEQRVAERTAELEQANTRICQAQADLVQSEKMVLLGQLVAGVTHEINTPAGAITNVAGDGLDHLTGLARAAMSLLDAPSDARQWLAATIPHATDPDALMRGIGDHDARRAIERALRRREVADVQRVAEVLAACKLETTDADALRHLAREPVLAFLEHLTSLSASSEITRISIQKITRIVKALRYYSRSGEGELFDIDINDSIENTLIILHNRIKHIGRVEKRYERSLPLVRCGPDISQVWTNLLANACDAIEEASGAGTGLIRIATAADEARLVVEIFNEGLPIPDDIMGRICDPFFTTKPLGKGTGLGLSICSGILRRYGGGLSVHNEPGGVALRVWLPLKERPPTPGTASADSSADDAIVEPSFTGVDS